MDCPPTNEDVETRIKKYIATRLEKNHRFADINVFRVGLDGIIKRRNEKESSLTVVETKKKLAESELTTLEEQEKAAKLSLTELEEEQKLFVASMVEHTGLSEQYLFASFQELSRVKSRSEVTRHLNIGRNADGLDYSGGSGDQVLGIPGRLTAPTTVLVLTSIKESQTQTTDSTTSDTSRGTEPLQSDPGVGSSRDTNRWHLREDMTRIQSSDIPPDEFIFVLRGRPSTEQYVLRCPGQCNDPKRPYVAHGIFTKKPFTRGRAFRHFSTCHSGKFPPQLEAAEVQRFIFTHFAKKVEWNTDRSQRRNKCKEPTRCDLDKYSPEGGVSQRFNEWKISGSAPEPRANRARVDKEANTDPRRSSRSPSVASSPATPFNPEDADDAEYEPSPRMS